MLKYHAKKLVTISLILCIVSEAGLTLFFLPKISHSSVLRFGLIFELIGLCSLLFVFFALQRAQLFNNKIYFILSSGLFLWIMSGVADVLDELVKQPFWLSLWGEDVLRCVGMLMCASGVFSTVRELSFSAEKANNLAMIDDLTLVPNRRSFNQNMSLKKNIPLYVLLIDLDNFKKINDTFGHEYGDFILQRFAHVLKGVTDDESFSARLGGEEFVLCTRCDVLSKSVAIANELLNRTRSIQLKDGNYLTASIGITLKSSNELPHQAMLRADQALYKAKENGRDRLECFEFSSGTEC
ncbi:conserved membrane hypothetical protein [Vibrio coralliirubri]|uniref:GGDEF domain-containing protein n=1 Tax=Vibrio coralliirubri TaxID=1516159 RepID=UPI000637C6F4|nr:GGDEF domain-containing protein [Vibrio coralliirubri]CDT33967.1 conserved membrane hypothetical protein [Vibrio coralliirubri]